MWLSGDSTYRSLLKWSTILVGLFVGSCSSDLTPIEAALDQHNDELADSLINLEIEAGSTDPELFLLKAELHIERKQWELALDNIKQVGLMDPENHEAIVLEGNVYYYTDSEAALEFFEELVGTHHYEDEEIVTTHGFVLMDLGMYEEALDVFTVAVEIDRYAYTVFNLAYAYDVVGDLQVAEQLYIECLSYDPKDEWALFNLGEMMYESGEMKRSAEYFQRLVDVNPEDYEGWYYLALVHFALESEMACSYIQVAISGGFEPAEAVQKEYCTNEV